MKKMKNQCKRGLSLLIVLVMCLSMLQVTAFADSSALDEALKSATGKTEESAETKSDEIEAKQNQHTDEVIKDAVEGFKKDVIDYVNQASSENPPEDLKEPDFKDAAEEAIRDSIYGDVAEADGELRSELEKDQDLKGAVEDVKDGIKDVMNQDFEGEDGVDALNKAAKDKADALEQAMKDNGLLNDDGSVREGTHDGEIDSIVDEAAKKGNQYAEEAAGEAGEEGRDLVEQANSSVDAALNQANEAKSAAAGIVEAAEQAVKDAQDRTLTQDERQAAADQIEAQVEVLEESVNATNSAVAKAEEDYAAASKKVGDLIAELEDRLAGLMEEVEGQFGDINLPDLQAQLKAAYDALERAEKKLEAARNAQKTAAEMVKQAQDLLGKYAEELGLDVNVEIDVDYTSKSVNKDVLDELVQQAKDAKVIQDAKDALEESGITNPDGILEALEADKELKQKREDTWKEIEDIKAPRPKGVTSNIEYSKEFDAAASEYQETMNTLNIWFSNPDTGLDNIDSCLNAARKYTENPDFLAYLNFVDDETAKTGVQLYEAWLKMLEELEKLDSYYEARNSARGKLSPEEKELADLLSGSYDERNDPDGEKQKKKQELQDALDEYEKVKKEHPGVETIDWNDEELWKRLLQDTEFSTSVNPDGKDPNGLFESAKEYLRGLLDEIWPERQQDFEDASERVRTAEKEVGDTRKKVEELESKLQQLQEQLKDKKEKALAELQEQLDEAKAELALKKDELEQAKAAQAEAKDALDRAKEILKGLEVWTPDPEDDEDDTPSRTSSSVSNNTPSNAPAANPGSPSNAPAANPGSPSNAPAANPGNNPATDVPALNAPEANAPAGNAPEAGVPNAAAPIANITGAGVPQVNTPAVVETNEPGEAENLVDIADGEVPLAGIAGISRLSRLEGPANQFHFMWWWLLLLLIVVCVTTRQIMKNKKREDQN